MYYRAFNKKTKTQNSYFRIRLSYFSCSYCYSESYYCYSRTFGWDYNFPMLDLYNCQIPLTKNKQKKKNSIFIVKIN